MNRSLRRWHFRLVAGLAPVAALTLAASIAVRKSVPDNPTPTLLRATAPADLRETGRSVIRNEGLAIELRRLVSPAGLNFIELHPLTRIHVADLLVYLGSSTSDALPGDSRLLGAISGAEPARFALPADSTGSRSELFLYSGATHTVLAHLTLPGSGQVAP